VDRKIPFGELYCSVALQIDRLVPGYLVYYYGPEKTKKIVEKRKTSPEQVLSQIRTLADLVDEEEKIRREFLHKEIVAMETVVRKVLGEEFSYRDEVRKLYDIEPTRISEKEIDNVKNELCDLLGSSDIRKSLQTWRLSKRATFDQIRTAIGFLKHEYSTRTSKILIMPKEEECAFNLVRNRPWGGYNWYCGSYRSRVEINLDKPVSLLSLPALVAHESYPGHHAEGCIKERFLFHERGLLETSADIMNSPQRVISNSIANIALDLIYEDRRLIYEQLGKLLGIEVTGKDLQVSRLLERLEHTRKNAALMMYDEGKTRKEALDYLVEVGLQDARSAEVELRFITKKIWRTHIFCYFDMTDIMRKMLPKIRNQAMKLYVTEFCPSQIDQVFS